ncbi:MAG TPA: hypothetical protein VLT87_12900 [Thermoanaerobaculia bacterium]|nr:hypothetical protein [Thermoanaerobaculia bacterium]
MSSRKAAKKSSPAPGVRVRMYNTGLGDCFLLSFEMSGGERPRHVLIDCGALATPAAEKRLSRVARHILETARPGGIDVAILTHPALGSVSGFLRAGESLSELPIGEVWAAWTEDPHDPVARTLERRRTAALEGLRAATAHLHAAAHPSAELLEPLLGLFGKPEEDGGPTEARRAFETMFRSGAAVRFQAPGDRPCPLPGVPGVRVYVLGPPRSGGMEQPGRDREEGLALGEDTSFFLAALAAQGKEMDGPEKDLRDRCFPFEKSFRMPVDEARTHSFFQRHYFGEPGEEGEMAWRKVESEWTGSSTRLALELDRDVNDASLALAFELPDGKVLLFPGNAQEAQWRSWQRLSWPREEDRDNPVTVSDLLRRTVLYKASHHGSQAGTPWEDGLARMTHPDLTVMVPVDEAEAREGHPGSWDFPFGPLLERFREVARGRVLLPDRCLPDRPDRISREEWKAFEGRSKCEPGLYVEVTIPFEETP